MTADFGARLVINDDVDLALMIGADGIHIGQDDWPVSAVRQLVGESMAIGLSTHSPAQAAAAVQAGVDYIGVGPLFPTSTKKDVCAPVGLNYLEHVVREITFPLWLLVASRRTISRKWSNGVRGAFAWSQK